MKSFKKMLAEVAQPKSEDELNFKEKHVIDVLDHPESEEHQHTAEKPKAKRKADYAPGEDEEVYESKMDPVDQKALKGKFKDRADKDIDNDGDVDSSDKYLHSRRKAIAKAMREAIMNRAGLAENMNAAAIGRKLQQMAPKEKNDMISNAMANLGDHLESYGTTFGARNMKELEKKTGLPANVIKSLIKRAGGMTESADLNEKDDAVWMVTWKQKNTGNDGREYMDSTQFHKTEREARLHKGKLKHDPSVLRNSPVMKKVKSRNMGEEVELDESDEARAQRALSARKVQQDAKVKAGIPLRRPGEGLAAYVTRKAKAQAKMQKEEVEQIDESVRNVGDKMLKFLATTGTPHATYSRSEIKAEHERRMKYDSIYRNTKPLYAKEEVELDEAKTDIYHQHMLKALGKSRLPKNHQYTSAIATNGDFVVKDGGSRIVGRIPKGEHNLKEEVDLTENFKQGSMKLNDGSAVVIKKQDADLLNKLFKDLNAANKKQMMKVAMTDKDGFNEILGFAREAL